MFSSLDMVSEVETEEESRNDAGILVDIFTTDLASQVGEFVAVGVGTIVSSEGSIDEEVIEPRANVLRGGHSSSPSSGPLLLWRLLFSLNVALVGSDLCLIWRCFCRPVAVLYFLSQELS